MNVDGKIKTISLWVFFVFSVPICAQVKDSTASGFLIKRDFGQYYVSDIYSPANRIQSGSVPNATDYNNNRNRTAQKIIVLEFTLGTDIPLYVKTLKLWKGTMRFAVAGSLSANVWFDCLNRQSVPILNVDYRAGLPELYLLKEINTGFLKNVMIRLALLQHESTHIGDELALFRKEAGFPITRVNVSYETGEASVTLNDPWSTGSNNHSFSIGGKFLYPFHGSRGYYSMASADADPAAFVASKRRVEGYIRYQYDGPSGPLRIGRFYPVVSAELRERIRFGYSLYESDKSSPNGFRTVTLGEEYAPCINIYAGWRQVKTSQNIGRLGGYFRYYSGINPHGQFRNIPGFSFLGLAVVYEI